VEHAETIPDRKSFLAKVEASIPVDKTTANIVGARAKSSVIIDFGIRAYPTVMCHGFFL
jgi:hypothetical protein